MSLIKRKGSPYWWIRFTVNGRRLQKSSGTADRTRAQQYHDKLKAESWAVDRLGERPVYHWEDAVLRFLAETKGKASHQDDVRRLRWIYPHLAGRRLDAINRDLVDRIGQAKKAESSAATANRHLAVIRTILRRACLEWEWLDRVPKVRLFPEAKRRIRFLTREEADKLIGLLPKHQAELARFALATGLRQANILELEWSQLDLERSVAWVHSDQAKARQAIGVPLNQDAIACVRRQEGKHKRRVFTYRGRPIKAANTKAWKSALKKAGIEDFRWHDLRHTWASWHTMAGTSMAELQELGGWETMSMVRKYAHLNSDHLAAAAERIVPQGGPLLGGPDGH
jgi:integrase